MKPDPSRPLASTEIIVSELDGEALIYDTRDYRAHCVSEVAYRVFRACDGTRTVAEIATAVGVAQTEVSRAVAEMTAAGLLAKPPAPRGVDLARRRALTQAAMTAGLAVAAPMLWSIVAPTVAQAASLPNMCANPAASCQGLSDGTCCSLGSSGLTGTCMNMACVP